MRHPVASFAGFSILLAFACAAFVVTHAALAQPYPSKPVRIIVPYTPGGSNDVLGRMVAKHMQEALKQPFIVENKPGAAGQIGAEAAAKSAARRLHACWSRPTT